MARDPEVTRANAVKHVDMALHDLLMRFARQRLGEDWLRESVDIFLDGALQAHLPAEMELALPWVLFRCPAFENEASVAAVMSIEWRGRLSREQHAMLSAQTQTRLSIWEVTEVEPGVGMALADLLTGAVAFVHEVKATETITVGSAILARVVEIDDVAFIAGVHGRLLAPQHADIAVAAMRRECRVRTRPIKAERLLDHMRQLVLVEIWRSVVELADAPPTLSNTDGDPLTFITDRFDFTAKGRAGVVARVATLAGVGPASEIDAGTEFVVVREGTGSRPASSDSVIARIEVRGGHLLVETNSVARADAMRAMLTDSLGKEVRYRVRSEQNTAALVQDALDARSAGQPSPPPESTPEMDEALRQFREQYMQRWLDDSIPALGGITPRQAAANAKHHTALRRLLAEVEHHERRLPKAQQCDMAKLRAELGM